MDDLERDLRESLRAVMASEPYVGRGVLDELGWSDVFEENRRLAVQTLFEEAGRAAVATAGHDAMLGLLIEDKSDYVLVVQDHSLEDVPDGGVVTVRRAVVTSVPGTVVVVDHRAGELHGAAEIEPDTTWNLEKVTGAHAGSRLTMLSGEGRLRRRFTQSAAEDLDRLVLLALSHERCGVAQGLLEIAVRHVSQRHQFGVPIGSLQAVQHRLAAVKVAIDAAASTLHAAWDVPDELGTLVAVGASAAALTDSVRDCLQVCGGMGFTDEFPLSALMRRALVLQTSGPSGRDVESLVGRRLRESGVRRIGEIDRLDQGRVTA